MMKKVVIQSRKFLFIFVTLLLAYGTMLREEVSAQTQQMSVKFENMSLLDALGHLSKQTGGKILYNHERIDKSVRINVVLTNKALPDILNKCLQGSRWGICYFRERRGGCSRKEGDCGERKCKG